MKMKNLRTIILILLLINLVSNKDFEYHYFRITPQPMNDGTPALVSQITLQSEGIRSLRLFNENTQTRHRIRQHHANKQYQRQRSKLRQ